MEDPIEVAEAPFQEVKRDVDFLGQMPGDPQFVSRRSIEVGPVDGGTFCIHIGAVDDRIDEVTDLPTGAVHFLTDAAHATWLTFQHAAAFIQYGERLPLLEVDDEALHPGFDDGQGAVHPSVGGKRSIVVGRLEACSSTVHRHEGLTQGGQVLFSRLGTTGGQAEEQKWPAAQHHAMRSKPV